MDLKNYNLLQEQENLKQIALDFDGVIHKNSLGFHDGTIYDDPIEGSLEGVKRLAELGYEIIIFTCKARRDRPLVNGKLGAVLVWEWLEKHGFSQYIKSVTSDKPRAIAYVDDKAIRFTNWKDTLLEFK